MDIVKSTGATFQRTYLTETAKRNLVRDETCDVHVHSHFTMVTLYISHHNTAVAIMNPWSSKIVTFTGCSMLYYRSLYAGLRKEKRLYARKELLLAESFELSDCQEVKRK